VIADQRMLIKPLTSLRFFAALMVVAHHYFGFTAGFSGVTFFYVLSGYILTLNYAGKVGTWAEIKLFWWKRFARIYPTHLLTVAAALPLGSSLAVLPLNLLLVHSWVPAQSVYFSFNGPSWSISNEAAFYAVFPWLLGFVTPRRLLAWGAGVIVAALFIHADFAFYIFPPVRLFEFALGILLARYAPPRRIGLWGELGAIALAGLCVSAFYLHPGSFGWSLLYVPGAATMVYVFSRSSGPLTRLLSSSPLVLLGDASFMLYMIHVPLSAYVPLDPLVLTLAAVGLSVALHLGFERPAQRSLLLRYGSTVSRRAPGFA
jgi:peptidoglycan/LPS O-acetylase OafA/YrhL